MAEQGTCDTIPAPQNLAFRVEPRKLDGIRLHHGDDDDDYHSGPGLHDPNPEGSWLAGSGASTSGNPTGTGLFSHLDASGLGLGSSSTVFPPNSNHSGNFPSASTSNLAEGSSSNHSTSTTTPFNSSHSATPFVSAVTLGKKIVAPSPVPANARRLCMRHQRSADGGVNLQLQKVRLFAFCRFPAPIFRFGMGMAQFRAVTRRVRF